jgi:phage terminase large subunit-like protein
VKATRDHPIEWWMTGGRVGQIVRALEQFHSAIVDSEATHDGSNALTRHVLNARRRTSRSGIQIAKEHPESIHKIDAAVAAVLAWQARLDALAAGVTAHDQFVPRRIR